MPSKLREKFLGTSREVEAGQAFLENIRPHIPELIAEQQAHGGSIEDIIAACIVDAVMVGYVGGRNDERMFVRNLMMEAARDQMKRGPKIALPGAV